MKVVALMAWSNGSYSMEEKSVADIPDALAEELITKGVVAESPDYYGGGGSGGGGIVVANVINNGDYTFKLDKTWQELHDAEYAVARHAAGAVSFLWLTRIQYQSMGSKYTVDMKVEANNGSAATWYTLEAASADDYPAGAW